MNFLTAKTIHFTGIKGVGMTALAALAQDLKKTISGSDTDEVFPTDAWLKKNSLRIKIGFSPKNLPKNCDLVVYTGAHQGAANAEVLAAKKAGISVINYAQALSQICAGKTLIATAGVGGKSSTAALIATVLETAGVNPGWAVGAGNFKPLNRPGRYREKSPYFVAETDEFVADPGRDFTPKFHYLQPAVAVITNIEHDHPDIYAGLNEVFSSFSGFAGKLQPGGVVLANIDSSNVKLWLKSVTQPKLTFGFSPLADWRIINSRTAAEKQIFSLKYKNMIFRDLVLHLPGRYNLENACAAAAAANFLGISEEKISQGIRSFEGIKRRFELIAEVNRVRLYDDYAHHPLELKAVLTAAREWLPGRRLIAVFQPHTYSRTKALLPQFVSSLLFADAVIINDIFASARETETLGISGKILAGEIKKKKREVYYAADKAATLERLKDLIRPGDVIFTLGAGNNWLWHRDIIKLLKAL